METIAKINFEIWRPRLANSSSSCREVVSKNEIYVDVETGCKTRKRVKMLSCRGECSSSTVGSSGEISSSSSSSSSQLDKFKLLDPNAKFSYLIGTNKRETSRQSSQCCQVIKRKSRKLRLFCQDGSSYLSEINMVKKCSCSPRCSSGGGGL